MRGGGGGGQGIGNAGDIIFTIYNKTGHGAILPFLDKGICPILCFGRPFLVNVFLVELII